MNAKKGTKKMKNRVISTIILSLIIISAVLAAACSDETTKQPETTESVATETGETEDTRVYPDLPDVNYDGQDFRMLTWDGSAVPSLYSEEMDGEVVNDAVYERNSAIAEKYGVTFSCVYQAMGDINGTLNEIVQAGDNAFEAVFPRCFDAAWTLTNYNTLADLNNLTYINLDKPWWDQNAKNDLSIKGHRFMLISDITVDDNSATVAVIFNKKIQEDLSLGNFYDLVYSGDWTWEKMTEFAAAATNDVNGDSQMTDADRYGIFSGDSYTFIMLNAGGGKYIANDADGVPYSAFNNDRTMTLATEAVEMMYKDYFYHDYVLNMFTGDQGLFLIESLIFTPQLRAMESDFGVIPVPKYTEDQENYLSTVSPHVCSCLTVPLTVTNYDMVSVILEAMAAESRYSVLPAYYSTVLKEKFSRDETSKDMLDIIFTNRVYDLGVYFGFGNFGEAHLRIYKTGNSDLASLYAKNEKSIDTSLKKLTAIADRFTQ